MDIEELAKRRNETPQEVMMGGVNNDYNAIIKNLINQAISDYSQIGDRKKNQKYADFVDDSKRRGKGFARVAVGPAANIARGFQQTIDAAGLLMDPNVYMTPDQRSAAALQVALAANTSALPFAQGGAGTVGTLKWKTDLAEGMTKLKDADKEELIRMILPFERKELYDGRTNYVNPKSRDRRGNPSEEYSIDFRDPTHAIISTAYSGESKGKGELNKKLYAMFANEGFLNHDPDILTRPNLVSVMNIVEPYTLKGIPNSKLGPDGLISGEDLLETLWGKTPKRLGERFGGEAQGISMGVSDPDGMARLAKDYGINLHDREAMLNWYKKNYMNEGLQQGSQGGDLWKAFENGDLWKSLQNEDLWKAFQGVDFHSKIKYPNK